MSDNYITRCHRRLGSVPVGDRRPAEWEPAPDRESLGPQWPTVEQPSQNVKEVLLWSVRVSCRCNMVVSLVPIYRTESQRQTDGFGLSVTHGWVAQPECERSAAMVRRTLGQYVAVCSHLQLTSHTQPTSTLSRIKCERYIFIKKCVRSFIKVRHYCWLCFRLYLYIYTAILQ